MNTLNLRKKLHERLRTPALTVFALAAALACSLSVTTWAEALYTVSGTNETVIVFAGGRKHADLTGRVVDISANAKGSDIILPAGLDVTIYRDGAILTTRSYSETIAALLFRMNIFVSPLEMVGMDRTENTLTLTVDEDITFYDEVTASAAFNTVRIANPDLAEGEERVVQEGRNGVQTAVYEVVWSGGSQISRQLVETLETTVQDQIIEYGTNTFSMGNQSPITQVNKNADGSGTLVLASGTTLKFREAKSMTATAYTAGHGGADYVTATGTTVGIGTVAVDKRVIPLGTRMYIVTDDGIVYGLSVACDTGVRGNKVDLYHNTYNDCIQFGRRSCTVYILE